MRCIAVMMIDLPSPRQPENASQYDLLQIFSQHEPSIYTTVKLLDTVLAAESTGESSASQRAVGDYVVRFHLRDALMRIQRLSPSCCFSMYSLPLDTAASNRWWWPPSLPSAVRVKISAQ